MNTGERKAVPYDATESLVWHLTPALLLPVVWSCWAHEGWPGNTPELRFGFQNDEFGRGPPQSSAENARDPEVTASQPQLLTAFPWKCLNFLLEKTLYSNWFCLSLTFTWGHLGNETNIWPETRSWARFIPSELYQQTHIEPGVLSLNVGTRLSQGRSRGHSDLTVD